MSVVADQQASLRRVAALVASGAAPADVFASIAQEVAQVLRPRFVQIFRWEPDGSATVVGTWGDPPNPFPVGSNWPRTEPAAAGAPIVVDGKPWGTIGFRAAKDAPLPDRVEERLAEFTDLLAVAIASSANREQLTRLADEQAALRRVAMFVARGAPPADIFDAVAAELGRLLDVGSSGMVRYEDDETATVVAGWGRLGEVVPVGTRLPLGGVNLVSQIARTGMAARMDDFERDGTGPVAEQARRLKTRASVGGPIVVAGRLWGAMIAAALEGEPLPPDIEARLEQFTELVGTAVANTEARAELARLADEQAALRRVATLVAEEAPVAELFAKVAEEVARVIGSGIDSAIVRYEADGTATVVAVHGEPPVDAGDVAARHAEQSEVGCPIVVQNRLWGAMVVAHHEAEPLPADAERRVSQFTSLVATAIANAEARAELQRLAEEQAALRRVATLVAGAAAPTQVFNAAIAEVGRLLGAAQVGMMRYESSHEATIVAQHGQDPAVTQVGMRVSLEGDSATARVHRTGRPARIDFHDETGGPIARLAIRNGVGATVGAPITVEGAMWGVITASWDLRSLPPPDAEERLAEFAKLLDTAIANADSRDQLTASRARVVTAGDEARRRLVRDLHDGAQQRLVHTIVTLKLAQRAVGEEPERAESLLADALDHAEQGNVELRELAHGILPSVLTRGGLRAGVDSLVARLDLPVRVDVTSARLPPDVEASAYFIVAEALTNVVKHSQAASAQVTAAIDDGTLSVEVRDDGVGGADRDGHGLLGVGDRVAALGGRLRVDSRPGEGTVLVAALPLPSSTPG